MGKRTIPFGRIERAEELYLSSKGDREIVKMLRDEFGVSKRQAIEYLSRARKRCVEVCKGISIEEHRAKIESLLMRAYNVAEIGTERGPQTASMVAAAAKLADIYGVTAPVRTELTGKNGGPIETAARVVVLPELSDGTVGDEGESAGTPADASSSNLSRKQG